VSNWTFEAWDTLFFRESRPHDTSGGTELASLFPPPIRTLAGAIRTWIGTQLGVDWQGYAASAGKPYWVNEIDLVHQIGFGDDVGCLRLRGPWPTYKNRRLYPAPAFLVEGRGRNKGVPERGRLFIADPVHGDFGRVHMPSCDLIGAKARPGNWLTTRGLTRVLAGGLPGPDQVFSEEQLFQGEPRLGIARNNQNRVPLEGLLYQTQHIRPHEDLAFQVEVTGIHAGIKLPKSGQVRFGGEGRLASVEINEPEPGLEPKRPESGAETRGIVLCLLTPADLDGDWKPPGFQPRRVNNTTTWTGMIGGIRLELLAAAIGEPTYRGGWDMARRRPRPMRAWLPAGSTWYCRVLDGSYDKALKALHLSLIHTHNKLGLGQLAAGLWQESEYPNLEATP